ncbi:MAG: putative portal protein [Prokaryotic dsDNA virus sp.]|nr:MAG: putative portal protein [Prokaryotic dsDNA virus sp.]|tara:strand:+ start:1094 stop:3064 length:1971 start_codon:yes stop_codon:yes gene_type:complete
MAKRNTKATGDYHFSSVGSTYDLTSAVELDKKGFDWIWYGADNLYPQHTINLYQNSATHNALVNSISGWIYGGGIDADNKLMHPEQWARFNSLINKKIGKNDIQLMCMDLKLHGGFYLSLTYSIDRKSIASMDVIPYETMRSGHANEDGDVEHYYYSNNWADGRRAKVKTMCAFDPERKIEHPTQVLCVKMNTVGSYYYPKPDYIGAWNYIELDKNVSQYHLSQIEKGLAPSYIINFANGIPAREKREQIKNQIEMELSGSQNAGKFLCTFSDGKDTTPEITPVPLSDADKQYQFLSEEITKKVMISHRVVSPRLFGVIDAGNGLGSNAEELQTASALFEQTVVIPFRDVIIDALKIVMLEDQMNLNLFFEPFDLFKTEFADTEAETINEEEAIDVIPKTKIIDETKDETIKNLSGDCGCKQEFITPNPCYKGYEAIGTKIKDGREVPNCVPIEAKKLSDEKAELLLQEIEQYALKNDTEVWDLVSEEWVDTTKEGFHQFNTMPTKSMADADSKSKEGDVGLYKVRYVYEHTAGKDAKDSSRLFCKKMMQFTRSGVEWRYEDIISMGKAGVNGALSEKGQSTYNIFLYKGGANCYHGWIRRIYMRKRDASGKFMPNKGLDNEKRVGNNPFIRQKGSESIAPIDTPNHGYVNPPKNR